jgi:hypothetical protein
MKDAGRRESRVTGRQDLGLGADLNGAATLQENIEFVLALMRVKSVLLSRLKRVQTSKKKITLS